MCCCDKPTINGQPGYKWQPNNPPSIRAVDPPLLDSDDSLIYDEPGRCGGLDAHCHHYCVVKCFGSYYLYARHGGGDVRIRLSLTPTMENTLASLDTTARYWLLHAIYHAHEAGSETAREKTEQRWRKAAAEKRIKTRKQPGQAVVKVWIEPEKN